MEINTEKIKALPLRVVAGTTNDKTEQPYQYEGEYDYATQDLFFEPAEEEEELIQQLNTKLLVTEISSDQLMYVRCTLAETLLKLTLKHAVCALPSFTVGYLAPNYPHNFPSSLCSVGLPKLCCR